MQTAFSAKNAENAHTKMHKQNAKNETHKKYKQLYTNFCVGREVWGMAALVLEVVELNAKHTTA